MICTSCNIDKSLASFHWRNKKNGKRHRWCKSCQKESKDRNYRDNRTKRIKQATARSKQIRKEYKSHIREHFKDHPCVDCGETDIVVLQFDHVRGKKIATISQLIYREISRDALKKEIKKCDSRCANCHIRRHAKERGYHTFLDLQHSEEPIQVLGPAC